MARTKYYHADEAANLLGLSIDEVRIMLANGAIKGHKQARRWLVDMEQPCFDKLNVRMTECQSVQPVIQYIKDSEHEEIISKYLKSVRHSLYIATANFKNVHINAKTLISILNSMEKKGIEIKVICAKLQSSEPTTFELIECPRNHMKLFIFDKKVMYIGSANLTPAALEDRTNRSRKTNNHEAGILTTNNEVINRALKHFDDAIDTSDCETCTIQNCKLRNN